VSLNRVVTYEVVVYMLYWIRQSAAYCVHLNAQECIERSIAATLATAAALSDRIVESIGLISSLSSPGVRRHLEN